MGCAQRFPKAADTSCSPGPIYNLPEAGRLGSGARRPMKKEMRKEMREAKEAKEAQEAKAKERAKTPPLPPPTCGKPPKKPRFRMHLVHSLSGAKHGMWGYF